MRVAMAYWMGRRSHGRGDNGLEGGRHAHHGMPRLLVGRHLSLGIGAKTPVDDLVVEVAQKPVHLRDRPPRERAEHQPPPQASFWGRRVL